MDILPVFCQQFIVFEMKDPFCIKRKDYQLAELKDLRLDCTVNSSCAGQMRASRAPDPQRCPEPQEPQQGLPTAPSISSLKHKDLPLASKSLNWRLAFCSASHFGCYLHRVSFYIRALLPKLQVQCSEQPKQEPLPAHKPPVMFLISLVPWFTPSPAPSQEIVLSPVVYLVKLRHCSQGRLLFLHLDSNNNSLAEMQTVPSKNKDPQKFSYIQS